MRNTGFFLLYVVLLTASSCVTHKRGILDYGEFPEVQLLAPSEARRVQWASKGELNGQIKQDDWEAVMGLLSRIPDLGESPRELVNVVCYGDPTIAVYIQLGYNTMVQFVKIDKTTWRIAGIYHYDI